MRVIYWTVTIGECYSVHDSIHLTILMYNIILWRVRKHRRLMSIGELGSIVVSSNIWCLNPSHLDAINRCPLLALFDGLLHDAVLHTKCHETIHECLHA